MDKEIFIDYIEKALGLLNEEKARIENTGCDESVRQMELCTRKGAIDALVSLRTVMRLY